MPLESLPTHPEDRIGSYDFAYPKPATDPASRDNFMDRFNDYARTLGVEVINTTAGVYRDQLIAELSQISRLSSGEM